MRLKARQPQPTNQILVKFRTPVSAPAYARAFSAQALRFGAQALPLSGQPVQPALTYQHTIDSIGWHVFRMPSPDALPATLAALRSDPNVLYAEPDQHVHLLIAPPTNPGWGQLNSSCLFPSWFNAISGDDSTFPGDPRQYDSAGWYYNWHWNVVNALGAWNVYPGYYPSATDRLTMMASNPASLPLVAVIDTGIDFNHPAFAYPGPLGTNQGDRTDVSYGGQIQTNLARDFYEGIHTDTNPLDAMDVFGHGTSVAGLVGAGPNNGGMLPGLGFMCRLVPIRIFGSDGDGLDSDLVYAITYATNNGCLLINVSAATDQGYSVALQDAVNYAWNHGTLVIAASGNDGDPTTSPNPGLTRRYPASCARVLSVGASTFVGNDIVVGGVDYTGSIITQEGPADYSNFGLSLGVLAPAGQADSIGLGTIFYNQVSDPDNQATVDEIMEEIASLDPASGLDDGEVPEYVFPYMPAPTYIVPLSDPSDPNFGSYAAIGLYNLNYGAAPGTSFACPEVVGLAALYAAKNGITQSTPNGPLRILQAIESGADNLSGDSTGGFDLDGGTAYGRINAAATLQDQNERNTNVGGVVGIAEFGETVQFSVGVNATPVNSTTVQNSATSGSPDGVYHILDLPTGNYVISANILNHPVSQMVHVTAGADVFADMIAPLTVTITPQPTFLPYGKTLPLQAAVAYNVNTKVRWILLGGPGSLTNVTTGSCTYKAPLTASPSASNMVTIEAISMADSTVSTYYTFYLVNPLPIGAPTPIGPSHPGTGPGLHP
jgi:serine protease